MSQFTFVKTAKSHEALAAPYQKFKDNMIQMGTIDPVAARSVVSTTESLTTANVEKLNGVVLSMEGLMKDLHDQLSPIKRNDKDGKAVYTAEQLQQRAALATAGMVMASDPMGQALASQTLQAPPSQAYGAKTFNLESVGAGFHNKRTIYTPEAFQNYDLNNSRIFSALFNYSIVDFDDFTRTFWRPVTVSPDSSFVELLINVLTVFDGYEHKLSATADDWRRRNLVRAIANHEILHTDLTQAIPSVNTDNTDWFSTKIAPVTIEQAGRPITTAPIVAPVSGLDYIGLCMPDWLIKTGMLDQRDNLDPGVALDKLYIALADDVLEFNVRGYQGTMFNAAPQGDRQLISLSWTTASLRVDKDSLNQDKTALVDLASVVTGDLILKIRLDVQAELNIETGELTFNRGIPSIRSLQQADGTVIAATDARYTTIKTALAGVTEVSFSLRAFRSNADRRQRGQLINIRQFAENVTVPWRDPIAAERPAANSSEQDTPDLTALMSATRIRIGNEGITALLDADQAILNSAVNKDEYDNYAAPVTLGIGRHYVLPVHVSEELDMLDYVDSISSSDRLRDIQAVFIAVLRNLAANAYTDSEYKAASDVLSGGTAPRPKIALVTDPVTAMYIIEPGDLRTLGQFEVVIVPVLDYRMRGEIKMVFITDDGGSDVNYLNFGYLFWSPEHVLVANMSRTGAFNRETQLQPRYYHYVACPIMMSVTVKNLAEALKKVTINMHEVDPATP